METTCFDLGSVEQIPLGQGHWFLIGGQDVAVFRGRNGRLFAIEDRCAHRAGSLADGIMGEGKIVCPLHGHKFDLTTGQGSEDCECVKTFPVEEKDGKIVLSYPFPTTEAEKNVGATDFQR